MDDPVNYFYVSEQMVADYFGFWRYRGRWIWMHAGAVDFTPESLSGFYRSEKPLYRMEDIFSKKNIAKPAALCPGVSGPAALLE